MAPLMSCLLLVAYVCYDIVMLLCMAPMQQCSTRKAIQSKGVETDALAGHPDLSSASCDLDL